MDWSLLFDCSYKKPLEKGKTLEMESKVGVDWGWEQELVQQGRRELSEGMEVFSAGPLVVMVAQHNCIYVRKATDLYTNNGISIMPQQRVEPSLHHVPLRPGLAWPHPCLPSLTHPPELH